MVLPWYQSVRERPAILCLEAKTPKDENLCKIGINVSVEKVTDYMYYTVIMLNGSGAVDISDSPWYRDVKACGS